MNNEELKVDLANLIDKTSSIIEILKKDRNISDENLFAWLGGAHAAIGMLAYQVLTLHERLEGLEAK